MRIDEALPQKKFLEAVKRSRTPEFQALKAKAIQDIKTWLAQPGVSQRLAPALWMSYGKDGSAVHLLLNLAGVDFQPLVVDCGGELPTHWLVVPELDVFFASLGQKRKPIWYKTEKRFIDMMNETINWGRLNGVTKKDGTLIDFFDMGPMQEHLDFISNGCFRLNYIGTEQGVPQFWGNRAAEAMDRHYEIQQHGLFQKRDLEHLGLYYWRALPIGKWRDLDVWALLVEHDVPVSPIYSMHELPQHGGKQAFPRTQYYCHSWGFNSTYIKWLKHYFPAQLQEIIDIFPEVAALFEKKPAAAS